MRERASMPTLKIAYSKRSLRQSPTGWAWDFQFVAPLSRPMAAVCWFGTVIPMEPFFRSRFLLTDLVLHNFIFFWNRGGWIHPRQKGKRMKETIGTQRVVYVIDDDASTREALKSLLGSVGLRVQTFG